MRHSDPFLFAVLTAGLALTGCAKKNEFVAPPPPEVGVEIPEIKTTTVFSEYAGRTSGSARVEIRARVKGFLQAYHFDAGQYVEKGQLLFTIEPEQFEAAVETAKGNLAKAEADLEIATTSWKKLKKAFEGSGAVSEIDVLSAEAERKAAQAGVDIARAALSDAERDLGYTKIHAPFAGRVSSALVDQGNLVGVADPTLLTDIITTQPIYFNFDGSERETLKYLQDMPNAENPTGSGKGKELELQLVLSDGTPFEEVGRFDFADNSVDPDSGTIRLRASFENKKGLLVDGLFARIRIPNEVENAVLVPAAAIQRDLGGSFMMVVGEGNVIQRRTVVPTSLNVGNKKIIEPFDEASGTGLQADERFVVSNLQRVREGVTVRIEKPAAAPPGSDSTADPNGSVKETEKAKEKAE